MRNLVYRPAALDDLDTIFDYIAPENPRRALSFVDEIRKSCRTLCDHPELGRSRAYIKSCLRALPLRQRVIVFYRITDAEIVIVRVFSGGRDYETIMRDDVSQ
jgi:toxin ParE1/3/4